MNKQERLRTCERIQMRLCDTLRCEHVYLPMEHRSQGGLTRATEGTNQARLLCPQHANAQASAATTPAAIGNGGHGSTLPGAVSR